MSDVVSFLNERHKDAYLVFNLCVERDYPSSHFNDRVCKDFTFHDHNPIQLERLIYFCKEVEEWLAKDEKNVVVIHCKAGKGRTGLCSSAYLMYSRLWENPEDALAYYAMARTRDGHGVTIPSQRYYVHLFKKVIDEGGMRSQVTIFLKRLRMHGLPAFKSLHFVVLRDGVDPVYTSPTVKVSKLKKEDALLVDWDISAPMTGDVKIVFYDGSKKTFAVWLHASYIENGYLRREKKQIDNAVKDKKHKIYPSDFALEFFFDIPTPPTIPTGPPLGSDSIVDATFEDDADDDGSAGSSAPASDAPESDAPAASNTADGGADESGDNSDDGSASASSSASPRDSWVSFHLPFASSPALQAKYVNPNARSPRVGKLLELLDAMAGTAAYAHAGMGMYDTEGDGQRDAFFATASIDRIDLLNHVALDKDIAIHGCVVWAGSSSMDVRIEVTHEVPDGPPIPLMLASFVMVGRSTSDGSAFRVPALIPSSPLELEWNEAAALKRLRRKAGGRKRTLIAEPPSSAEQEHLHELWARRTAAEENAASRDWTDMTSTALDSTTLTMPQSKNVHSKIFGGYLVRQAFELAYTDALLACKGARPEFRTVSDISFIHPVEIGSVLQFKSLLVHTHEQSLQARVAAIVIDPSTGNKLDDGIGSPPCVMPYSYEETMLYLAGRRRAQSNAALRSSSTFQPTDYADLFGDDVEPLQLDLSFLPSGSEYADV
ncbi:uncharacterized protein AMSG_12079 [Thecamonas trahens ATCC 50062]|uniref:Phosphatidylinositol-3,4,5-trisphosphate 3-phosphatase n=1 Tax=Thecamonas trahens ATCC 50062 TaxID=461836 RepID=A0A0L0DJZ6_THETB|nr:hypothetical protein AMSG_12079 [Thecamonas trahens ATCC 50062]KNC51633.1 hypothetical protein AMSG_12079 [Thecamonas trahens ATCC 50062]|eukprot:XP_013756043.1 hypothetical protein AMSG_12079 [Thecamonas trahens ATCC 50062]